jgi:cytochrome c peroxidase
MNLRPSMSMNSARAAALLALGALPVIAHAQPVPPPPPPLPPVPVPQGNQITEAKRILGKVLFWDEQLSTTNAMSCGTCHMPSAGGGDPRVARNNGPDNLLNNADDVFASPGVVAADAFNDFRRSSESDLAPQVGTRHAPTMINAAYSQLLFWDGRAGMPFRDPQTNAIVLNGPVALESQAVGPPLSSTEMAHDQRTYDQIAEKLIEARPLALATTLPADVQAVLADGSNYATLFKRAFGDANITGARIGLALATYQRTLIANQTPVDLWSAGNPNALTQQQRQGWGVFNAPGSNCVACHAAPTFSGPVSNFHNIGLRPAADDIGRQAVTGNINDRGRMKTPTLRNVGLRERFMHNGQFSTLAEVINFYDQDPGAPVMVQDNLDPAVQNINIPENVEAALIDFLANALTDPRVAAETFPFDRPDLWSQRVAQQPADLGGSAPISTVGAPQILVTDPAMLGGQVRVGLAGAPAGAQAVLRVSPTAPTGGVIAADQVLGPFTVDADGVITARIDLPFTIAPGTPVHAQWFVSATQGNGRSSVVRMTTFCPRGGCPSACPADLAGPGQSGAPDGQYSADDLIVYINRYFAQSPLADIASPGQVAKPDGELTSDDIIVFVNRFFSGCEA